MDVGARPAERLDHGGAIRVSVYKPASSAREQAFQNGRDPFSSQEEGLLQILKGGIEPPCGIAMIQSERDFIGDAQHRAHRGLDIE